MSFHRIPGLPDAPSPPTFKKEGRSSAFLKMKMKGTTHEHWVEVPLKFSTARKMSQVWLFPFLLSLVGRPVVLNLAKLFSKVQSMHCGLKCAPHIGRQEEHLKRCKTRNSTTIRAILANGASAASESTQPSDLDELEVEATPHNGVSSPCSTKFPSSYSLSLLSSLSLRQPL